MFHGLSIMGAVPPCRPPSSWTQIDYFMELYDPLGQVIRVSFNMQLEKPSQGAFGSLFKERQL